MTDKLTLKLKELLIAIYQYGNKNNNYNISIKELTEKIKDSNETSLISRATSLDGKKWLIYHKANEGEKAKTVEFVKEATEKITNIEYLKNISLKD